MENSKPPVIILSGIRWDFLWQRHQILATRFARAGYPTIFVETTGLANPRPDRSTLRKIRNRLRRSGGGGEPAPKIPNLTVYSPLTAPPTWNLFRISNRRLFVPRAARDLRKIAGEDPVVVAYPPTRTTLDLTLSLNPRLLYYDCSEDYKGFPRVPGDIADTERELVDRADLVSCTAPSLLEKIKPLRPDAFLSGPGVDYEQFAILQGDLNPKAVKTVCYFGHLGRERISLDSLEAVAEAGFTVRVVGEVGHGRVERNFLQASGVDYRGEVRHEDLPAALKGVDAFLLPYLRNKLTLGISPAKTYECLATGRPVVASPLPALKALGEHLYLARSPHEFVEALLGMSEPDTEERARARTEVARENSWDARFAEIEERLCRVLESR